jgi:tetratricopeptide (TPR) repeat protein
MAEIDKNVKNWLIKSSSKITGPFSALEIAQLLVKKHISIIDEARQPNSRWAYVREHPVFAEVVQSLRHEQSNNMEETVNTSPGTQTISKTDWTVTTLNDSGTPTPVVKNDGPYPLNESATKDVSSSILVLTGTSPLPVVTAPAPSTAPAATSTSTSPNSGGTGETFGIANDPRIQMRVKERTRGFSFLIWTMTLVIVAGVGLIVFKKYRGDSTGYDDYIKQALHYNQIQLYDTAIEYYHKAQDIREPDQLTSFQLALPLIQAEPQTTRYRQVLESGLNNQKLNLQETIDTYIGIALTFVVEGDLKKAQDYFNKVLALDPRNFPANIDLAYNFIKRGDYADAGKVFNGLSPSVNYRPYILFGTATLAAESQTLQSDLEADLKAYIETPQPLRKEIALLLAYLGSQSNDDEVLNSAMTAIVHMPLYESTTFVLDPRIDRKIADWQYLEKYCAEIFEKNNSTVVSKAFRAVCLMEEHRDPEAKKWIEEALAQEPKNPEANLSHVRYLINSRHLLEASALLKSPAMEGLSETTFLLGKVCNELNDKKCAMSQFEKALKQKPENVARIYEWAQVSRSKESAAPTWELVKKGLEIQPRYKPLIDLRNQLENQ